MDIILDTHILIWALEDDPVLSQNAKELINDPDNNIYFSAVSVMEISIKHMKNPALMKKSGKDLYEKSLEAGYYTMPLKPKHAVCLDDLQVKESGLVNHDPFDRALIAQAKREKMYLMTSDSVMKYYDEPCIMIV